MITMFERYMALSAVNRDSCIAFLKTLAMLYQSYEHKYKPAHQRYLNVVASQSQDFVRQFKLTKEFDAAVKSVVAGANPVRDDKADLLISNLMEKIKEFRPKFHAETDISSVELTMLNDFRLAHLNNSEAAIKRLYKNINYLGEPKIAKLFVSESNDIDVSKTYAAHDKLLAKLGGAATGAVPTEVAEKWQAHFKNTGERLKDHKNFLAYNKVIRESAAAGLAQIVRNSGELLMRTRDAAAALDKLGIRHSIPKGFVGYVDSSGQYFTNEKRPLAVKGMSGVVVMNPEYDAKNDIGYVCTHEPPNAVSVYRVYTANYVANSKRTKFEASSIVTTKLATLTKKWVPDLSAADEGERKIATICELLYETSARVGSKSGSTKGEQTFGISSIQVRHVRQLQNGYSITYLGKSGQRQRHVIKGTSARLRQAVAALSDFIEGKKGKDYVFDNSRGTPITGTAIKKYLVSLGFPSAFKVHMLRTIRGTAEAKKLLAKSKFKPGGKWKESDVHKWVEGEMVKIGGILGHASNGKVTSSTAIDSYIDPTILQEFYDNLGIRPNAKIQKAIDAAGKA